MKDIKKYPIKEWPETERPRERLIQYGASTLSDSQLLAILLRVGDSSSGMSAVDLAREMINKGGDIKGIDQMTSGELCAIPGIGKAKTAQIKAAFEIGRRLNSGGKILKKIKCSKDVAVYYISRLGHLKKESFKTLLLDAKNKIIKDVLISKGSLTSSIVHPREVFNQAVKESAASIILIHNHPSGETTPSKEDIQLTKRLIDCGDLMGIKILDHLIIGNTGHYSFLDEGLI